MRYNFHLSFFLRLDALIEASNLLCSFKLFKLIAFSGGFIITLSNSATRKFLTEAFIVDVSKFLDSLGEVSCKLLNKFINCVNMVFLAIFNFY